MLVNLHYWCISTVSVFWCLLKELSDLMVANSILMSFQPPSLKSYFTFCFNQLGLLVPISHWWLIWSCSLINKDDLNVFYSQTYNSVAELNLEVFWFLLSVIKPDWHGQRSHNGIAAKMLAWILYVRKSPRVFSPLKVLFQHWSDTWHRFVFNVAIFPKTKKQHQFEFSGFELLFLVVDWVDWVFLHCPCILSCPHSLSFVPFLP